MLQGLRKSLLIVAIALFTPLVTVYGNDLQETWSTSDVITSIRIIPKS